MQSSESNKHSESCACEETTFEQMASRHAFRKRPFLYTFGSVAALLPITLYVNNHVAQLMWIRGASMAPFLNGDFDTSLQRDVVLVQMWAPWRTVKRGSVVTFWSPLNPEHMAIKRVIALEGDEVITRPPYPFPTAIVPPGAVWVEGDNIEGRKTLDSHWYGAIPQGLIVGQVRAVVWPWRKRGLVREEYWRESARVTKGKVSIRKSNTN